MADDMKLTDKMRAAAHAPDNWDWNGLLLDAADKLAKAEETIRDFAWRADCWSETDIIAHVADYFETTVAEIEKQIADAKGW